jgi:hypothetical protein
MTRTLADRVLFRRTSSRARATVRKDSALEPRAASLPVGEPVPQVCFVRFTLEGFSWQRAVIGSAQ